MDNIDRMKKSKYRLKYKKYISIFRAINSFFQISIIEFWEIFVDRFREKKYYN